MRRWTFFFVLVAVTAFYVWHYRLLASSPDPSHHTPAPPSLPPWFAPDPTPAPWWASLFNLSIKLFRQSRLFGSRTLQDVVVTPRWPNGSAATPVVLKVPTEEWTRDPTLQAWATPMNSNNQVHQAVQPSKWHRFDVAEASVLVPSTLAWMTDQRRMSGRAKQGRLDMDVARAVSRLVAASYCNVSSLAVWNCTRCARSGFELKRVVFDQLWDLLGFVGWSDELDGIVVAFRGTDSRSYYNWVENMRTWRTDLALNYDGMPPRALVHGGFFVSYNDSYLAGNVSEAVAEIIAEKTSHPAGSGGGGAGGDFWGGSFPYRNSSFGDSRTVLPTVFTSGHSLGGALATLAALDLKMSLNLSDVRVITFGSPRVGNHVFTKWFEEVVGPSWRFTHDRDIVPSVPPGYMGFHHLAHEIWVVDLLLEGRTLVGVCDGSGEDPRCHNSVCHLGLCTSVADHLLYLSEMYSPHPEGC